MSDKERLEHIEEKVQGLLTLADSEGYGEAHLSTIYNDMIWLIEQAEKAERYEKALENILISPFPLDIDGAVAIAKQALLEGSE